MLVFLALCGSHCARVGEPQPPLRLIPRPAESLKVHQVGHQIKLSFQLPESNIDGTPAEVREVHLFRCLEPDNPSASPPHIDRLRQDPFRIATMDSEQLKKFPRKAPIEMADSLNSVVDADPYHSIFYYAAEISGRKNRSAGLSGIQEFRPVAVANPVTLRAVLKLEAVRLEWDAPRLNIDGSSPARIAGYRVYRSLEDPARFNQPLATTLAENPWFEDRDRVFGRVARYAVSVVAVTEPAVAESLLSDTLEVEPRDIFAPATPDRLEAFGVSDTVSLRWDANHESDLLGYYLYRSESQEEIGSRLAAKPIEQTSYLDRGVERQKTYYYRLTAVDKAGNEGKPTAPVSAGATSP